AGADVFVGLSKADQVSQDMVRSMAENPIIFAMANPDPEITYEDAKAARSDVIMATGRSDYPNQVNNVLGFPFIFRGALDVRATTINEEMKLAATKALADLAKQDVPDSVMNAYGVDTLHFGREYLIPKPFDHRVLIWEAAAVAQAAMDSGVAQHPVDIEEYKEELEKRLGKAQHVMRIIINRAKIAPKRLVLPEGADRKILRAAQVIVDEGFAEPILLGNEERIRRRIEELELHLDNVVIEEPTADNERWKRYTEALFDLRHRKGITKADARKALRDPMAWGAMMLRLGEADALVGGISRHYPETLRTFLKVIGPRPDLSIVASVFMMIVKDRVYFFADPTVNINPTAEQLADIALASAEVAEHFHVEPRVAMLSFSNFGSVSHPEVTKVQKATELIRLRRPDLMVDGEMQADTAVEPALIEEFYSFSNLKRRANVLVFPEIQSANVAFKLVQRLGGAEAIGPILTGMNLPVHLVQYGCEAKDVVNMAAIAVVDAQEAGDLELPPMAELEEPETVPVG
ncbi:MAG: phosphate acyltransferase, partial [Thermoanaerobaculia bacterium]